VKLQGVEFDYVCFSIRPTEFAELIACSPDIAPRLVDGAGAISTAQMQNRCVETSEHDIVVIARDKARPTPGLVTETASLVASGFGFVMRYGPGFMGVHKELFRRIGPFDERFIGGCEDGDMVFRCKEAGIAVFRDASVRYKSHPDSAWLNQESVGKQFMDSKWGTTPSVGAERRQIEESHPKYNFGQSTGFQFKPWPESVLIA